MPVPQNIGVETVCETIKRMEQNSQHSQPNSVINNSPAMRGDSSDFTNERKRRAAEPSNKSAM